MRINITQSSGDIIRLRLPHGLVLNGLSATLFSAKLKKADVNLSGKQLRILFRAIRKYKREHPEWKLIEVQSQDGDTVEIVL